MMETSENTSTQSWVLKFARPDRTFVVELENDWPYHVVPSDPLYEEVAAKADEMGSALTEEPPPHEPEVTENTYRVAIQGHVDAKAQERRYDSGATMASYINSTVAEWAAEAIRFVEWRDQVWAYAYAALAEVEQGIRPQPTVEEILGELPTLEWAE